MNSSLLTNHRCCAIHTKKKGNEWLSLCTCPALWNERTGKKRKEEGERRAHLHAQLPCNAREGAREGLLFK